MPGYYQHKYWMGKYISNTVYITEQSLLCLTFQSLGGGFLGLVHPYLVADITFGTGRFNVLSTFFIDFHTKRQSPCDLTFAMSYTSVGLTASCFGLGATMSNFLGQMVVEKFGHVTSLMGSFFISFVPLLLFAFFPETLGKRGHCKEAVPNHTEEDAPYESMMS